MTNYQMQRQGRPRPPYGKRTGKGYPYASGLTAHDPEAVMRYIVRYKLAHGGNSPSLRQICTACGVRSTSSCHYLLDHLRKRGLLNWQDGVARGFEVAGGYQNYPLGSVLTGAGKQVRNGDSGVEAPEE